ncbi:pyrimidine-nucleoside phosphorylase [Granulicella pectinivorans]|uniref:thymidine phosphorylase n=1 Tax=Granulicella pectinivorans TaxID=474950 RepID=A0A1I6M1X7_9BACT|nr:thymidine phosphorylase [Granulicella pectinivorans]SFS09673.1 pyrimidine-nucleoside phosphorylase [Granulicella pectinivorans]
MMHPGVIHPIDVILHKRDGLELSDAEIQGFVDAIVQRTEKNVLVTDAQIAAFLMAVFQRGLSARELATLTRAMRYSGEVFARTGPGFRVDKHSTGGVGDKTSLLIAPIVAAAGLIDPMISGRSLGHTGGTLDKLETIPGFSTQFSVAEFSRILGECGFAMAGQTPTLVPADRILYGMRDHTGTVESPFLITASIMSKKLAEDLDGLVLDVKVGSGAFMPTYEASKYLAELMVQTGEASGTKTVAVLTTMDEPLGRFAGNWVEVWECVDVLQGRRHPMSRDMIELSLVLAGWMLFLGGKAMTPEEGSALADELLSSGRAYESWLSMVKAQGGDISVFEDPAAFHQPKARRVLKASASGYFAGIDCREAGWAVQRLGAGRVVPGGPVSTHAGIEMHVKLGDTVVAGQDLITLFAEEEALLAEPFGMLERVVKISAEKPVVSALVREVVRKG